MWQDRMLVHANMASFGLTVNAYVSIIVNFSFGYSVTQIICTVDSLYLDYPISRTESSDPWTFI